MFFERKGTKEKHKSRVENRLGVRRSTLGCVRRFQLRARIDFELFGVTEPKVYYRSTRVETRGGLRLFGNLRRARGPRPFIKERRSIRGSGDALPVRHGEILLLLGNCVCLRKSPRRSWQILHSLLSRRRTAS